MAGSSSCLTRSSPDTLEGRLARFDIALSAVGVEHRPSGQWSAIVHPLARTSVERREVLLLKPLVNWKFVLSTLERMWRYADELGYIVPGRGGSGGLAGVRIAT